MGRIRRSQGGMNLCCNKQTRLGQAHEWFLEVDEQNEQPNNVEEDTSYNTTKFKEANWWNITPPIPPIVDVEAETSNFVHLKNGKTNISSLIQSWIQNTYIHSVLLSTSKYILSKNTCTYFWYVLHIRRKRRRKDCARHVVSYRLQRYFHKEMFVWDCI